MVYATAVAEMRTGAGMGVQKDDRLLIDCLGRVNDEPTPVSRAMLKGRGLGLPALPHTIRQLLFAPLPDAHVPVKIHGWVKSVRRQKNVAFAVVSDGSHDKGIQAVFPDASQARSLTNGTSVRLEGRLLASPGKGQDKELRVDSVEVLGRSDPEKYPIQKKELTVDYLRAHCHLRPRTDAIASMLWLRHIVSNSIRAFFEDNGFCYVHTPIITANDCEGAGETFRMAPDSTLPPVHSGDAASEFFGHPAYLTVSSQLHLEALAASISRVYTLSPCFRAERSQTNRHLAEFWMLEAEWAFTQTVHDVCNVVEAAVKQVLDDAADKSEGSNPWSERAAKLQAEIATRDWPRITYANAVEELASFQQATRAFHFGPAWGLPLQSEHERWLAENLAKGPVFVTDYPAELKPFYMRLNDDGKTVACFDLLMPGLGELVGGSLREEREDHLSNAMRKHGLQTDQYDWYLDLRRYGSAPHGGFGLGFERLISWVGGIENIRECIAMPRWAGRMLL